MNEGLTLEQLTYISAVAGVVAIVVSPFLRLNKRISDFEKSLMLQGEQLAQIAKHYREQEERRDKEQADMEKWREALDRRQGELSTTVAIHGESIRRLHDGRH